MSFGQLDHGGGPQLMREINVTPLVDVMLVLLVMFIITAPLLTHQIKLNLPKTNVQAASTQHPLSISLTRDGQIYLDALPITEAYLQSQLQQRVTAGEQPTVELRADGELPYQQVVRIMALVQNAGISKLSFITDPEAVVLPLVKQ